MMSKLSLLLFWIGLTVCPSFATDPISRHVIVISVDGLRPDALQTADAPHLKQAMINGSFSLEAQTIDPSLTLPSHTSMLTGLSPEHHGMRTNHWTQHQARFSLPTIFSLVHDAGFETAMIVGKDKFGFLAQPGSLDNSPIYPGASKSKFHYDSRTNFKMDVGRSLWADAADSSKVLESVSRYLSHHSPNLLFVHFSDPDILGHTFGWMSPQQLEGVHAVDGALGQLILQIGKKPEMADTIFIVSADHGGHFLTHGSRRDVDMTIPWICWGKSVARGHKITQPIVTYDTAATALYILGVPPPPLFDGRPIKEIFVSSPASN